MLTYLLFSVGKRESGVPVDNDHWVAVVTAVRQTCTKCTLRVLTQQ